VRFSLTSPTGVHIGEDQTAKVTVRAEWEGIGLGILGGVIGLLLILGIVRTIVRRRADRSDAAAEPSASE
jgi:prolipoprotein diacylglyceryltransferase